MSKIFYAISGVMLVLFCGILLIDRQNLNHAYSRIGEVIEEKDQQLQEAELRHKAEQENLQEKLHQQQRIFHIVTAHRALHQPSLPATKKSAIYPELEDLLPEKFTQYNGEPELLEPAQKLAELVEKPVSAENIAKAFKNHAKTIRPQSEFFMDPRDPQRIINGDAALFEALCSVLGYQCVTTLCWDMENMKHFFRTDLKSIQNEQDRAVLLAADLPDTAAAVISQDEAVSVLLPFLPFRLDKNDHYEIMADFHKIPVGGLYLHRIDVMRNPESTASEWCLEYSFDPTPAPVPEKAAETQSLSNRKPAGQTMLRALSLIPGAKIISTSSKGLQTFRIPFVNGRSSVLILGDTPVLPRRITARSVTAD